MGRAWRLELFPAMRLLAYSIITAVESYASSLPATVLSWSKPRIFVMDDLLSPEECDALISLGRGRLEPAQLAEAAGGTVRQESRRGAQMVFGVDDVAASPLLNATLERLHRAALLPPELGEGLQLGHYGVGDFYAAHYDTPRGTSGLASIIGGALPIRVATVLVYASEVPHGGGTLFLRRALPSDAATTDDVDRWSRCAGSRESLADCCDELARASGDDSSTGDIGDAPLLVKPRRGRGVVFFHRDWHGEFDPRSAHAACPVLEGEKWVLQLFLRTEPPPLPAAPRISDGRKESRADMLNRMLDEEQARLRGVTEASRRSAERYDEELEQIMARVDERREPRTEV